MVDLKKSIKKCFHVSVTFIFSLKNVLEEMTKKKKKCKFHPCAHSFNKLCLDTEV